MTFIDPQGNKTAAVPAGTNNIPVVDVSPKVPPAQTIPQPTIQPILNATKSPSSASLHADEFCKFIEIETLKIIKDLYVKGATPQERIQGMAKIALELIRPSMSIDELYRNAAKLDDQYSEFAPLVERIMKEYEETYNKKALSQVSHFIKNKQYDEAQNLVKKVLLYKMNA